MTHLDHVPPEKIPGAFWTREGCQALAAEVGPATVHLVETLLADPVLDRLPRVIRVLKLRERVGTPRAGSRVRPSALLRRPDLSDTHTHPRSWLGGRGPPHPHRSRTGLNICPDRRRAPG
jgi:hypothetical protein